MHGIPELAQSHAAILSRQRAQDILCSALVDNCLERYKTVKEGGAKYDWISGQQVGIANLGNSLSVIKHLVFADAQITQPQLAQALAENFAGNDNEQLRQRLINYAPGYGNDAVGQLLAEAYQACIDELDRQHSLWPWSYWRWLLRRHIKHLSKRAFALKQGLPHPLPSPRRLVVGAS